MLGPVVIGGLIAFTAPAFAQRQALLINPGAMVVHNQMLLRENPCVQGQEGRLDERACVLIVAAGLHCDGFHEPILRRLDALVIIGTVAGVAAGNLILGRLLRSASA
jgi:hypothetical protein